MTEPRYIAMWSGPRNISTAMMRSWENRPDTFVHDEPFYAHYLQTTGYEHPGADEVIATYETDWRKVVQEITGTIPDDKAIYFQKHMTHHMLDNMEWDWVLALTNCFLIREPRRVLLSYIKVVENPKIDQLGLIQQVELFHFVRAKTGQIPPVLSAKDALTNPRRALSALCAAIDTPFMETMLQWPAGKRKTDGCWAKYWYSSVEKSTDFMPYRQDDRPVPEDMRALLEECDELYNQMAQYRLLKDYD